MAVADQRSNSSGSYGDIEPLTLQVLYEELKKLKGTLQDDLMMDYKKTLVITDEFIDELGQCINLSIEKYPDGKAIYDDVFSGLQDVIDLIHGFKKDLNGSDGQSRVMDDQESRLSASDRVVEIMEYIQEHTSQQTTVRTKLADQLAEPPKILPQRKKETTS